MIRACAAQFMKKMFYKIDVLFIDQPKDAPNPEVLSTSTGTSPHVVVV